LRRETGWPAWSRPPAASPRIGEAPAPQPPGAQSDAIDINSADEELLKRLPGIGEVKARAIISFREANGPFSSADGLLEVNGIGAATLEAIRDLVEAR
jgi:competence protein ComEA